MSFDSGEGFSPPPGNVPGLEHWFAQVRALFLDTVQLPSYTVANLPDGKRGGEAAYASDGRKNGETAGNGTGVQVFYDGDNWIAVDTGATVAA